MFCRISGRCNLPVLARTLESRNPDKFYAIRALIEKFLDPQRADVAKGMKTAA